MAQHRVTLLATAALAAATLQTPSSAHAANTVDPARLGHVRAGSGGVACNTFTDYVYDWTADRLVEVNGYKTTCRASTLRARRRGLPR